MLGWQDERFCHRMLQAQYFGLELVQGGGEIEGSGIIKKFKCYLIKRGSLGPLK